MLDGETPGFHIQVATILALQGPRVIRLLPDAAKARKSGILLLKLGLQIRARTARGSTSSKTADLNAKRVAFQSSIQIVVLRRAVVDAKTGTKHSLSMERTGRPD